MSQLIEVKVPDIGDFSDVPIIELYVKVGDTLAVDDAIATLESDKATMDVPSSAAGVVKEVLVKLGDTVSEGSVLIKLEAAGAAAAAPAPAGIYTAAMDGARASWVVRPDRTITGVMDNSAPGDHKVSDAQAAASRQYQEQVRQMRLDQQMQQAPPMHYGTWSTVIHDRPVTATPVRGAMRF